MKRSNQRCFVCNKNILIKELKKPTDNIEYVDLYLDLITTLSEEELIVLFHHKCFDKKYDKELEELSVLETRLNNVIKNRKNERLVIGKSRYQDEIKEIETKRGPIRQKHEELKKYRKAEHYGIDDEKFFFYKQRLYSKGLLYDNGIGRTKIRPFEMMSITEFGFEFIDFIIGEN